MSHLIPHAEHENKVVQLAATALSCRCERWERSGEYYPTVGLQRPSSEASFSSSSLSLWLWRALASSIFGGPPRTGRDRYADKLRLRCLRASLRNPKVLLPLLLLLLLKVHWKGTDWRPRRKAPPPSLSLSLDPNVVIHFAWSCCCCWATCPCPASAVVSFSVSPPLSSCCFVWFPAVCLSVRPLRPSFNSSLLRTYIRSDTVRNRLTVVDPLVNQKSLIEELYLQRIARTTRLICRSYFNGLSAAFPLLHLHFSPSPSSFYFIWNPHLSRTTAAAATVPVESTRRLICFYDVSNPDER